MVLTFLNIYFMSTKAKFGRFAVITGLLHLIFLSALAQVPDIPVLIEPEDDSSNVPTSPTFIWGGALGAEAYTLEVSTQSDFSSSLIFESEINDTQYSTLGLDHETEYYWRVYASNEQGSSGWSEINSFITGIAVPQAPELSSPANNATGVSTNPTFTWQPSPGATSYRLQVSKNSDISSAIVDQEGITETSYLVSGLEIGTQYFWRVNARNPGGPGEFSQTWNFTTVSTQPIVSTQAVSGIGTTTATGNGTISYLGDPPATQHGHVWSTSQNPTTSNSKTELGVPSGTGAFTSSMTSLSPATTYYVRAYASNTGAPVYGSQVSFITTPPAPTLASPANGATDVSTTPTLSWNSVSGANRYEVEVHGNSGFTNLIFQNQNVTGTSVSVSPALQNGTTYYWRVRAANDGGESGWSSRSFTTVVAAPSAPTLASPANGATGVSTTPTLSWNSVSGANRYEVEVHGNSGFTNLIFQNQNVTGTSVSVSPALQNGTTYYWRVRAVNDGGSSGWSSRSFTTVVAAPSAPTLASPANGATGVSTTPTLSWNSVSGANRYEVEVHGNSGFTNLIFQNQNVTGTSVSVSPALQNGTTYYWRVRAVNDGGSSGWSSRSFTTVVAAPSTPTLATPSDGATGVVTIPTLTWNTASGAESYNLQLTTKIIFRLH
jgi:hypothetical protein